MNLLGIESSGQVASVAIIKDDELIAEYTLNSGLTHSQTLLPMIEAVVKASGVDKKSLDAIAISKGPGSFTGLRIGSATAKGLGLALELPLVEVSTLLGLAYNLKECEGKLICPIIDSRRQEVYAAIFEFNKTDEGYEPVTIMEDKAMTLIAFIEKLNELGKPCIFCGDGVKAYSDIIRENIKCQYSFATGRNLLVNAAAVSEAAVQLYKAGKTCNADDHSPEYLRLSQAEREMLDKTSK